MLLWIIFSVMAGLAVLAIIAPLARKRDAAATRAEGDIAVYRDQLSAIDEEVARGVIVASEAAAARTEISRRLLAASERRNEEAPPRPASTHRYFPISLMLGIGVIAVSTAGYLALGSPERPGQPLAQRLALPTGEQDPQMLLAKFEAYLQANPEDGKGWDLVAPVYLDLDRFEDAARAYANALRLLGDDAERLAGLGQALTHAAEGTVTAAARDAFERALVLDPGLAPARFYLALAFEQEGALKKAAESWRMLLATAPAEAPWRPVVEQHLAAIDVGLGEEAPAANLPAEQSEMIEQMVARLAERLKTDGSDPNDWVMLMRSYTVLARMAEAQETLARARERFANDRAALEAIEAAAGTLGLNDAAPPGGGPT
ncbi:MAG: c-type cytochrome biogenesis protein CcmI [Hyphomicrobiales bacterium]|nr:c-type cytochrome biogenesis protein CcmI [Hyphomicrobiales bacterium]